MRNINKWRPSKYVYHKGKLISSRDTNEVSASSRLMVDLIAQKYDQYLRVYCKGKLIDLGCGKVPLYASYKDYVNDNICVDWKNTLHKNIYLDKQCDLTKKLPFKNREFDTLILSDVLEHIPEPEKLFREMARILKKGSIIFLNVPFYYWLHELPYDFYRYTEYSLKRFSDKTGFEVLVFESLGGAPEVVADILAKNVKDIKFIGSKTAALIQKLARIFITKTAYGRRLSQHTSKHFPFGYFMVLKKR